MRALIAGARGEQHGPRAGGPRHRGDPQVELARRRVQGRGDAAPERKRCRRADGRRRPGCDPRRARAAARGIGIDAARTSCSPRTAATAPPATIFSPRPRACAGFGPSRSADRGCRRSRGGKARQGAVRPCRQHDRPAGRARRPRVDSKRRSGRQPSTPSTSASTTTRWCSTNGSRSRPRRSGTDTVDQVLKLAQHPDFMITNPNRLRSLAGTFGAQSLGVPLGGRARLRLPRRHDHRRRQAQPADRRAARAAARPLAAVRAEARGDDARGARADRCGAGLSKDVYEQVTKSWLIEEARMAAITVKAGERALGSPPLNVCDGETGGAWSLCGGSKRRAARRGPLNDTAWSEVFNILTGNSFGETSSSPGSVTVGIHFMPAGGA